MKTLPVGTESCSTWLFGIVTCVKSCETMALGRSVRFKRRAEAYSVYILGFRVYVKYYNIRKF